MWIRANHFLYSSPIPLPVLETAWLICICNVAFNNQAVDNKILWFLQTSRLQRTGKQARVTTRKVVCFKGNFTSHAVVGVSLLLYKFKILKQL